MQTLDQKIFKAAENAETTDLFYLVAEKYKDESAEKILLRQCEWLYISVDYSDAEIAGQHAATLAGELLYKYKHISLYDLYFDLSCLYLLEEEGVPKNSEQGFKHLRYAQKYLTTSALIRWKEKIKELDTKLIGEDLKKIKELFPYLNDKNK